jgi:hypothetical protein
VSPADAALDLLQGGWPLVVGDAELDLRTLLDFDDAANRATTLVAGPGQRCKVAAVGDCTTFWPDRDVNRLALQRAERLAAEYKQ